MTLDRFERRRIRREWAAIRKDTRLNRKQQLTALRRYFDVALPEDAVRIADCIESAEHGGRFGPVFTKRLRKMYPQYAAEYDSVVAAWRTSPAGQQWKRIQEASVRSKEERAKASITDLFLSPKKARERREAHTVLGVRDGAPQDEIRSAMRRLAREFHPDINPQGAERMVAINRAYAVLENKSELGI
jgi:hypothetical protein